MKHLILATILFSFTVPVKAAFSYTPLSPRSEKVISNNYVTTFGPIPERRRETAEEQWVKSHDKPYPNLERVRVRLSYFNRLTELYGVPNANEGKDLELIDRHCRTVRITKEMFKKGPYRYLGDEREDLLFGEAYYKGGVPYAYVIYPHAVKVKVCQIFVADKKSLEGLGTIDPGDGSYQTQMVYFKLKKPNATQRGMTENAVITEYWRRPRDKQGQPKVYQYTTVKGSGNTVPYIESFNSNKDIKFNE